MPSNESLVESLERIVYGGVAITTTALQRASGSSELTFQQWRAIVVVGETDEGYRVGQVARRIPATLAATSRLLRRLERRGLMTLRRDETDRRATLAGLTPEGVRLRSTVLAYRREQLAALVASVEPAGSLAGGLAEIAARIEGYGR